MNPKESYPRESIELRVFTSVFGVPMFGARVSHKGIESNPVFGVPVYPTSPQELRQGGSRNSYGNAVLLTCCLASKVPTAPVTPA